MKDLAEDVARIDQFVTIAGGVVCLLGLGVSIYLFWMAVDPQRYVALMRKNKGVDVMASVCERDTYFRFIRRNLFLLGFVFIFLIALVGYRLIIFKDATFGFFGDATAGEYLEAREKYEDTVGDIGEVAEKILQTVEKAQSDAEVNAAAGDESQKERLEALEQLHEAVSDLKKATEKTDS